MPDWFIYSFLLLFIIWNMLIIIGFVMFTFRIYDLSVHVANIKDIMDKMKSKIHTIENRYIEPADKN